VQIDCDFDGGSIQILDASDPSAVALALRKDDASDFKQWFYFRVTGAAGMDLGLRIVDAGESSFPDGWSDLYRAVASYDGDRWFRVPTEYDGAALTIRHTPEHDVVAYACFAPFPIERRDALIAAAHASPRSFVVTLGKSVEGRPINVIAFGDQGRRVPRVWVIAHQHPGETMAGFCVEGLLGRLFDEGDPVASALLDRAEVYVVPTMNPDGSARGNHRTNAAGRDLNREWLSPDERLAPEVYLVREAMRHGGVDMFLDVHGEEAIPYVFSFGTEGVPGRSDRLAELEARFDESLARIDENFQLEHGYDLDPPGEADLRLASMYVSKRFQCLSVGLETPFKDDANHPDPELGWSPDRCRRFGGSLVEAIFSCIDSLR
jgi:murein tripeptide amidase MpaA